MEIDWSGWYRKIKQRGGLIAQSGARWTTYIVSGSTQNICGGMKGFEPISAVKYNHLHLFRKIFYFSMKVYVNVTNISTIL